MFQNGTEKIKFGYSLYNKPGFSVQISFSKKQYYSVIDISLKSDNPSEIAKGIYNEILNRINQHKTYNYIYHNAYMPFIGGAAIGSMPGVIFLFYLNHFRWGIYLFAILLLIIIICAKGAYYKPYCEFSTSKQLKYNRTFNFIVAGIIVPSILGILFEIFK